MSGWFLFTTQEDCGPFIETEEVSEPTIEAIDSCLRTVHYDVQY